MVICPERDAEFGLNVAIPFVRLPVYRLLHAGRLC